MAESAKYEQAVIILDMAKGYGWAPGGFGYEMVARVRRLKDAAYAAGTQVVHVNSMRRPTDNLPNASRLQPRTEAVDVIDELGPFDRDIIIYKRYLSGFSHNDLDYTLRTMGCKRVLICGASTDNTVLWTAADAHQNRYEVAIVEDCTMVHRQQEPPGAQEGAIRIMRGVLHADIVSLDEAIQKYLRPR
jgi:nicotinamidase-related amidase